MQNTDRPSLDKRALIFFLLVISFVMMIASGIFLDDIHFENEMIAKIISKVFHKVGVSIFFLTVIFHIYYNWKAFLRYFKKGNNFKYLKEFAISVILTTIVIIISTGYTYYH